MAVSHATMRLVKGGQPKPHQINSRALADDGLFGLGLKESAEMIIITTASFDIPGPQIVYVSPPFSRMTGYQKEELIGQSPFVLNGPRTDKNIIRRLYERSTAGDGFSGEIIYYCKDGSERAVELEVSPIRDHRDVVTHFLLNHRTSCEDTSENKRLETMILRAQRMESIGALASAIAHDLNNVLSPILMVLHTLQQKSADEARSLSIIRQSAEQGKVLVERILAFARGEEGERAPFPTTNLIGSIASILEETLPKNIELQVETPHDLWNVVGDTSQLQQVLMNLCINARDAMPTGGKLMIEAGNRLLPKEEQRAPANATPNKFVSITVADTGIGIPGEIIEQVFEPFFTTKERGHGSGLGLSTVLSIVRGHGGFIDLLSDVGKGTEFNIFLPAQS